MEGLELYPSGHPIHLRRETQVKARQPETKLGAIAQTRHTPQTRLVGQVPEQRQGQGAKALEGLDRHRHEGQGGRHLPMSTPLGGVPGGGRKPRGTRSAHSKGGSHRVDDGNVTHHNPAREQT
jgi:hypothetical protein